QAIIDAIESGYLNAEISICVSSRRDVKAPDRARKHNIPVAIIRPRDFVDAAAYDEALCAQLLEVKTDLIILAGYLSILGPKTMASFAGRIMNIHPSLLPAFGGKGFFGRFVHEKVLHYGCKVSGATVMFVDDQIDTGPIILQQSVDVLDTDTVETLTQKVSQVEKELYPLAIKLYAEGRLRIEGRRVKII
ncbi:MAG: phosphoribosylglycinamide formyltransferase, partial [Bacillota bacterium]|nr:phosphoribosylglycinamide formyltransferase [Bacillota bacterium]